MYRANSHDTAFSSIYLVQSDGVQTPIVLATNVATSLGQIIVDLPRTLVPSNACKWLQPSITKFFKSYFYVIK